MRIRRTAPADAYAPDPARAGPAASTAVPRWLLVFLAFLIMPVIEQWLALRTHRATRTKARNPKQPNQPIEPNPARPARHRDEVDKFVAHVLHHFRRMAGPQDGPPIAGAPAPAPAGDIAADAALALTPDPSVPVPGISGTDSAAVPATTPSRSRRSAARSHPPMRKPAPDPAVRPRLPVFPPFALVRAATGPPIGPLYPAPACPLSCV